VLIKRHELAVVFCRKSEQVKIGEVFGGEDRSVLEMSFIANRQGIWPETRDWNPSGQ
jgi:hypothetical protein